MWCLLWHMRTYDSRWWLNSSGRQNSDEVFNSKRKPGEDNSSLTTKLFVSGSMDKAVNQAQNPTFKYQKKK